MTVHDPIPSGGGPAPGEVMTCSGTVALNEGRGSLRMKVVNTADRQMAAEARRKAVEDDFAAAVQRAKAAGLDDDEIRAALEIILEETDR